MVSPTRLLVIAKVSPYTYFSLTGIFLATIAVIFDRWLVIESYAPDCLADIDISRC
jgi:hypothetical protein